MDGAALERLHRHTAALLALCTALVVLMFFLGARAGQKFCAHAPQAAPKQAPAPGQAPPTGP